MHGDQVLSQGVDFAIGHRDPLYDDNAINFLDLFYGSLFDGCSLQDSFDLAKSCSKGYLLKFPERDPRQFYLVPPEKRRALNQQNRAAACRSMRVQMLMQVCVLRIFVIVLVCDARAKHKLLTCPHPQYFLCHRSRRAQTYALALAFVGRLNRLHALGTNGLPPILRACAARHIARAHVIVVAFFN